MAGARADATHSTVMSGTVRDFARRVTFAYRQSWKTATASAKNNEVGAKDSKSSPRRGSFWGKMLYLLKQNQTFVCRFSGLSMKARSSLHVQATTRVSSLRARTVAVRGAGLPDENEAGF